MAEQTAEATEPTIRFWTENLKVRRNQKISDNMKTAIYLLIFL